MKRVSDCFLDRGLLHERVIEALREALSGDKTVADIAIEVGVSRVTFDKFLMGSVKISIPTMAKLDQWCTKYGK